MSYFVGVDLGTTYSAAAIATGTSSEIFPLGSRVPSIPSVVMLKEDGTLLVGEAAERRASSDPYRVAREFKRRLGDPTPILLGGTPYGADALSAALLGGIAAEVTERQGGAPELVAITHPANYGEYKIDLLEEAARLAGFDHVTFLTEPEAAALHYVESRHVDPGSIVAVYDFGGGTFDAAILQRTERGFTILGTPEGMERFGGVDLDDAVFGHVRDALGGAIEDVDAEDPAVVAALAKLRDECRAAKEALSEDTDTTIPVMLPSLHTQVRLTRTEFEDVIRPRVRDTISSLGRATESAGIGWDDLDRVLLVGGSSRIPLVGEMVRTATGNPVALDAHPKHTVALGAAQFARRWTTPAMAESSGPRPVEPSGETPADVDATPPGGPTISKTYRIALLALGALIVAVGAFSLLRGNGSETQLGQPPTTGDPEATTVAAGTLDSTTSVTEAVTTTVADTSTSSTAPATTLVDPDGLFQLVAGSEIFPPGPLPGSVAAAGSGCSAGGSLGDGIWFGYVNTRWEDDGTYGVDFDPACFYFGDAAYEEGEKDGVEVSNDYYVRNASEATTEIELSPTTDVHYISSSDGAEFLVIALAYWPAQGGGSYQCSVEERESDGSAIVDVMGDFCGMWLYINDAMVTQIVEQFVP